MLLPAQTRLLWWVQTPKGYGWGVTVVVCDPPSGEFNLGADVTRAIQSWIHNESEKNVQKTRGRTIYMRYQQRCKAAQKE